MAKKQKKLEELFPGKKLRDMPLMDAGMKERLNKHAVELNETRKRSEGNFDEDPARNLTL